MKKRVIKPIYAATYDAYFNSLVPVFPAKVGDYRIFIKVDDTDEFKYLPKGESSTCCWRVNTLSDIIDDLPEELQDLEPLDAFRMKKFCPGRDTFEDYNSDDEPSDTIHTDTFCEDCLVDKATYYIYKASDMWEDA